MWFVNPRRKTREISLLGTDAWEVDAVFNHPGRIWAWIAQQSTNGLHLGQQPGSRNGRDFIDRRHKISVPRLEELDRLIYSLCGQAPVEPHTFVSNVTRLVNTEYNSRAQNHYWWPHRDPGYTAIIYWDMDRTNVYTELAPDPNVIDGIAEHVDPWRPQRYYDLVHQFQGQPNRMVLFDGRLLHGMDHDPRYFQHQRVTMVNFYME